MRDGRVLGDQESAGNFSEGLCHAPVLTSRARVLRVCPQAQQALQPWLLLKASSRDTHGREAPLLAHRPPPLTALRRPHHAPTLTRVEGGFASYLGPAAWLSVRRLALCLCQWGGPTARIQFSRSRPSTGRSSAGQLSDAGSRECVEPAPLPTA